MNKIKSIFFIFIVFVLAGCSNAEMPTAQENSHEANLPEITKDLGYGYTKRSDKKIYHDDEILSFTSPKSKENIFPDYDSFEIVGESSGWYELVTKDKNYVFLDSLILPDADAESFEILPLYYMRDKNNLYNPSGLLMEGADPQDFEIIINAGEKVIVGGGVVEGADVKTFYALSSGYFKDHNNAYHQYYYECWGKCPAMKLEGSDGESFEVIAKHVAKDKNHVYVYSNIVENVDVGSFEVIFQSDSDNDGDGYPEMFAKDINHVYQLSFDHGYEVNNKFFPTFVVIEGADPKTFEIPN